MLGQASAPVDGRPADRRADGPGRAAGRRLALQRLTLNDFRSYAAARLDCDTRPVVLTGPNGAGKTNLLEALSFLAPGRGLRRATLAEVTRRAGAEGPQPAAWTVACRLLTPAGEVAIGTGLDPDGAEGAGRRLVRIDGRAARGQAELGRHLAVLWLTPQMDRLFAEGPGGRRRFLDRMVFSLHADHAGHLAAYEQAMRQRTRLLKDERIGQQRADAAWLAALEEVMAANGAAIAAARRDLVERLRLAAPAAESPFPPARLTVVGALEDGLAERPALAVEEAFRRRLAASRAADAAAGAAGEGPHRSDLVAWHAAKDMPAHQCSTGEQKALLIGLVLANARLLAAERGLPPLLLLDEVAAHLDARRRDALFEAVLGLACQAWMTGTDAALFQGLGKAARHLTVEDAHIRDSESMRDI